jgi:antitoxin component of MazEF toxin-antitoxin module
MMNTLHNRITTIGDSTVLVLSPELLLEMGINSGDEVDISIIGRTLIVRPLDEAERTQRIDDIIQNLLIRRQSAYERLAQGD